MKGVGEEEREERGQRAEGRAQSGGWLLRRRGGREGGRKRKVCKERLI